MTSIRDMFSTLRISASGTAAERMRIDVISRNIAHAEVTQMPDGSGAYRRQVVSFAPILDQSRNGQSVGVQVRGILPDMETPMQTINDPSHPDANEQGQVTMPNVNVTQEMADLIGAMRAYEANLNAQDGFIRIAERALRLAQ